MTTQMHTDLYRRWILELWNGDLDVADELVSADFTVHQARMDGTASESAEFRGPTGLRRMVRDGRAPFRTITFEIEVGPLVDGDLVAGRWHATGTYAGGIPGLDAPASTPVTYGGTDILRVADGRFVEYWVSADVHHLMAQLGPNA